MYCVSINEDCLDAVFDLPRSIQKKTKEFIKKFRANPKSPGINYEKIMNASDPKFRSVRIDKEYRAIIIKPEQDNVYILAWIDKHDDAYKWATNKRAEINSSTGALQVLHIEETLIHKPVIEEKEDELSKGLFENISDNMFFEIGLSKDLLPIVRNVKKEEDIFSIDLPEEITEVLMWYLEGFTWKEAVKESYITTGHSNIDTSDYIKALNHPDTRRRFVIIKDDEELEKILDQPLAKWRVFLHPNQDNIVKKNFNGPARVLGSAGTGKTVVAMHRARYLAQNIFTQDEDKILFVTFTKNLAVDIQKNLEFLCGDEIEKIEVLNIDTWIMNLGNKLGISSENIIEAKESDDYWFEVFDTLGQSSFGKSFVKDEWENVIQAQDINTFEKYLKTHRVSSCKKLSRSDRIELWKYFEEYRILLNQNNKIEWVDLKRMIRQFLETNRNNLNYKAAIIDEGQDLHVEDYKIIRQAIPKGKNDIFIVADSHQRIYSRKVLLSKSNINIRGGDCKLKINYRTTDEIRKWATSILNEEVFDDLDGNIDSLKDYKSLLFGEKPVIKIFDDFIEEKDYIISYINELIDKGVVPEKICLVARTNNLINEYRKYLNKKKITYVKLKKEKKDEGEGIRTGTIHRVKGLEFPHMIISSVNKDIIPYIPSGISEEEEKEILKREKCLLFVAATRARDSLLITSYDKPSFLITQYN